MRAGTSATPRWWPRPASMAGSTPSEPRSGLISNARKPTHLIVLRRVRASALCGAFRNRRHVCGRALARLRELQGLGQLAARHDHLPAMHRKKFPALIVAVELEA